MPFFYDGENRMDMTQLIAVLSLIAFVFGGAIAILFAQMNRIRELVTVNATALNDFKVEVAQNYVTKQYINERFDHLEQLLKAKGVA
jgi:hypothetical protein